MLLRALILLDGPLAIVVSPPTQGQLPDQTGPHGKPRFSAPVYTQTRAPPVLPEIVRGRAVVEALARSDCVVQLAHDDPQICWSDGRHRPRADEGRDPVVEAALALAVARAHLGGPSILAADVATFSGHGSYRIYGGQVNVERKPTFICTAYDDNKKRRKADPATLARAAKQLGAYYERFEDSGPRETPTTRAGDKRRQKGKGR